MAWVLEHLMPMIAVAGIIVGQIYAYARLLLTVQDMQAKQNEHEKQIAENSAAISVHITTDGLHRNADFRERFANLEHTSKENNQMLKEILSRMNQK